MSKTNTQAVEVTDLELDGVVGGHDKWIPIQSVHQSINRPTTQASGDFDGDSIDDIGLYTAKR